MWFGRFFLYSLSYKQYGKLYRDLERGESVKGIVLKQAVGGFLLLFFAMLCEGLIGIMVL